MGIIINASDPTNVFDAAEIDTEFGGDPTEAGTYALSVWDGGDGWGIAIKGTPTELFEWLTRARNELARRLDTDRSRAGTAAVCGDCKAPVGIECPDPCCTGRLDPAAPHDDGEDLAAVLRFEDAAEDRGELPADDRDTCHSCKAWATPDHLASDEHFNRSIV